MLHQYPNTSPDKKEISTDLYYQFLRLQMLHSTLNAKPRLYIHRKPEVKPPTIDEMKAYVGLDDKSIKPVTYSDTDESEKWLRDNIYTKDTKVEQKSTLFKEMASEDSITKFLDELKIIHQVDISTYKENLMTELANKYESQLDKAKEKVKQISYPNILFYDGERVDVAELTKEELIKQKTIIEKCGYSAAEKSLRILCKNEELKKEIETINSIVSFRLDNEDVLKQAKISGLLESADVISSIEKDLTKYNALLLNKDTIFADYESVDLLKLKNNLKTLQIKLTPYFELIKKLQKVDSNITVEGIDDTKLEALLSSAKSRLLSAAQEQEEAELYKKALTVLGYKFSDNTLSQTHAKVKGLADTEYKFFDYSYDALVSKINVIDSVLSNQEMFDLKKKIKDVNEKNKNLDDKNDKLQKLYKTATEKADEIRSLVGELSKAEYENVGPALGKFYNKLVRIDNTDGFNIIHENGGISLVDNKRKNIVNVLSNGQICVFMLAYFFAAINVRNNKEKMKVFFIDDLTACMDDVNMLAFMDLLKYQMDAKRTMEQLFFVTCDTRISNLLKYKMTGHDIELCELGEADFA